MLIKRNIENYLFKTYGKAPKVRLCTEGFIKDLYGKKVTRDRRRYLKNKFLGMYFFEEKLLSHDVKVLENINDRANAVLTKIRPGITMQRLLKTLRINRLPHFLFMEPDQYSRVMSVFEGFMPVFQKRRKVKTPGIVLCFDNKSKRNCMCVAQHIQMGHMRIRYEGPPTSSILGI